MRGRLHESRLAFSHVHILTTGQPTRTVFGFNDSSEDLSHTPQGREGVHLSEPPVLHASTVLLSTDLHPSVDRPSGIAPSRATRVLCPLSRRTRLGALLFPRLRLSTRHDHLVLLPQRCARGTIINDTCFLGARTPLTTQRSSEDGCASLPCANLVPAHGAVRRRRPARAAAAGVRRCTRSPGPSSQPARRLPPARRARP